MRTKIFSAIASTFVLCGSLVAASTNCYVEGKSVVSDEIGPVFKALNCLEKAIDLTKSIKDPDERKMVLDVLKSAMKGIKKAILKNDYETVSEIALCLHENIYEILSECSDVELCNEISSCICKMFDQLDGNS